MSSSFVKDCLDSSSVGSSNANKTVIIIVNNDSGNVALDGNELQNLLASHGADSCTQVSVVQMGQGGNSTDSLTFPASSIQGTDASNLLSHGLMPLNFTLDGFPSIALDGATVGSGYAELPLDADALRRLERVLETEEAREFLGEPLLNIVNDPENLLEPFEHMMLPSDESASVSYSSPSKIKRSSPKRRSQRQMDKAERDEVEKILAENQRMLQEEREYFRRIKEEKEEQERREIENENGDVDDVETETNDDIKEEQFKKVNTKVADGKGKKLNAIILDVKGKKISNKITNLKGKNLAKDEKGKKLNSIAADGKGKKLNTSAVSSKGKKFNTTLTDSKGKKLNTAAADSKGKKLNTTLTDSKGKKLNTAAADSKGQKLNTTSTDGKGKKLNTTAVDSKGKKLGATTNSKGKKLNASAADVKEKKVNINATNLKEKKANTKELNTVSKKKARKTGGKYTPIEHDSEGNQNDFESGNDCSNVKEVKLKVIAETSLTHSHDDNSNIVKELPMKRLSVKVKKLDVRGIDLSHGENCSDCDREDVVTTSIPPNQEEILFRLAPPADSDAVVGRIIGTAASSQGVKSDRPRLKRSNLSTISSPPEINPHVRFKDDLQSVPREGKEGSQNCGSNRNVVVSSSSSPTNITNDSSLNTRTLANSIMSNSLQSEATDKSRTCDNLSEELLSDNITKPKTNSKILMTNKNFSDVDPVKSSLESLSSHTVSSTTTITSPPRRKIHVVTPAEAKSVVDISGSNFNVKKVINAVNVKKAVDVNIVDSDGSKDEKVSPNLKEEKCKKNKISFESQLNLGNFASKVQKSSLKINTKNTEKSLTPIKSPNNILQHTPSISKNLMNYKIPLKSSALQKNLEFKENSCPPQIRSSPFQIRSSTSQIRSSPSDSSLWRKTDGSIKSPNFYKNSEKLSLGSELSPHSVPLFKGVSVKTELSHVSASNNDNASKDSQINSSILQRKNSLNIIKFQSASKDEPVIIKVKKNNDKPLDSNVSNINDKTKTLSLKTVQKDSFSNVPEMAAKIVSLKNDKPENNTVQAVRRSIRPIKKKKFADDIIYLGKNANLTKAKEESREVEEESEDDDDDTDSDTDKDVPFKKLQVETVDSSSEDSGSDLVDDDPGRLWCICQKPHNNRFMICCDRCEDWFHGSCVGVSKTLGKEMEEQECEWICPNCKKAERATKGFTTPSQKMLITEKQQDNSNVIKKKSKVSRETVPRVVMFEKSTGAVLMGSSAPVLTSIQDFLAANPNYQCVTPDMMKSVETDPTTGIKRIPLEKLGIIPEKKMQKLKSSSFQDIIDSANSNKSSKKETSVRATKFLEHSEVLKLEHESSKKLEKQSSKKSSKSKEEQSSKFKEEKSSKKIGSSVFYCKDKSSKMRKHSSDVADEISPNKKLLKEPKKASKTSEDIDKVLVKPDSIVLVRTSVQKMLYEALEKRMSEAKNEFTELSLDHLKTLCKEIEEQLYLVFNKDVGFKYKSRYRSLVFNIRDTKNGGLFRNILNGSIPPEKLACLTSEEMASKELIEWREKEEKKELEAIQKHELERLALGNQYIMKSHKGEIMIDKDDLISKSKDTESVINLAHDQSKPLPPIENQEDEAVNNHKNHIYDPNCNICASSELHEFAMNSSKHEINKLEFPDMKDNIEVEDNMKKEKRNHESSKHKKRDKERHRERNEDLEYRHKQHEKGRHKDRHRNIRSTSSDEDKKEKRNHRSERDSYEEKRRHHHKDHKSSRVEKKNKDHHHHKRRHGERSDDRKRKESGSSSNIRESFEDNSLDNSSRKEIKIESSPNMQVNEYSSDSSPLIKTENRLEKEIHPMESKVSTSDDVVFISQDSMDSSIGDIKDVEPTSTVIGTPVNDGCGERTSLSPVELVFKTDDSEREKINSEEAEIVVHLSTSYSPDIYPSNTPPLPNEPEIEEIFSPATPPLPDDVDEERLTPPPVSKKYQKIQRLSQPPVWKGIINMIDVAKFAVACFEVSGKPMFVKGELHPVVEVVGRISPDTVWSYIAQQKKSGSKEILVVRFQPSNEDEKAPYISFYSYLSNKRRYGVIGNCGKTIKDFYIVPLASHQPIPQVLLPLDGPGFEESRPHMLIGVLVRVKRRKVYDPVAGSWITNETPKPRTYSFDNFEDKDKDSVLETEDSVDEQSYTPPPSFGYEDKANELSKEEVIDSEPFSPPSEEAQNLAEEESSKEETEEQYRLDRELLLAELNRTIERDKKELSEMQKKAELKMEERERELEEEANNSDSHAHATENLALDTSKINIPSNLLEILNSIKQKEEAIKEKEDEIKRRLNMVEDDRRDIFSGSKDVDLRLLLPQKPDELLGAGGQDQDMRLLSNPARIPVVVDNKNMPTRDPRIAKGFLRRHKDENDVPSLSSMSDADLLAKAMEMEEPSMEDAHLAVHSLSAPSSRAYPLVPPNMIPPHPIMNPHDGGIPPPIYGPIDNTLNPIYGSEQPSPMPVHHGFAPKPNETLAQPFDYNRPTHNISSNQHQGPHGDYMSFPAIPDGDMRQMRDIRSNMDYKRNQRDQHWSQRERRGPEEWDPRYDGGWDSGRPDFPHPSNRFNQSGRAEWFPPNDHFDPNRKRRFPEGRRPPLNWRNDSKRIRKDQGW